MSVLTSDQQSLYDWARSSAPAGLFKSDTAAHEIWGALAIALDQCRQQGVDWTTATYITTATDVWLDAHATDRGTRRRDGESDELLRGRIRAYEDALTRAPIIAAAQDLIDIAAVSGTVYMVELRRDRAHLVANLPMSGTGGTFVGPTTSEMVFTPTVAFPGPPYRPVAEATKLVITGAADAANDGTYTISGADGDGARFTNALGVSAADATVEWKVHRYDSSDGERITSVAGRQDAYLSRGFRMGITGIILILPYGATAATRSAVLEMLRQKKAAGVVAIVERRMNP